MSKYITYDSSFENIRKTYNMLRRSYKYVDKLVHVYDKVTGIQVNVLEVTRRHIVRLWNVGLDGCFVSFYVSE